MSLASQDSEKYKYEESSRDPATKVPRELALGLNRHGGRVDSHGRREWLFLSAKRVRVGERVPFPDEFNTYEACLRFTYNGKTRYYGGGAPHSQYDTADGVLHGSFAQLVWVRDVYAADKSPGKDHPVSREVVEIAADYTNPKDGPRT